MTDDLLLKRIVTDSELMVGNPFIKGTRLSVEFILNLLAHGSTVQEIISECDSL